MVSPPSTTLIRDLEVLLDMAKTGDLRGLVYVSVWDDGTVKASGDTVALGDDAHNVIGQLFHLMGTIAQRTPIGL